MQTSDPPPLLDEHTAAHVAELFSAFSDTSRVRILSAIVQQELNVSALAGLVGIPAIEVELTNHQDLDWKQNLGGILLALEFPSK